MLLVLRFIHIEDTSEKAVARATVMAVAITPWLSFPCGTLWFLASISEDQGSGEKKKSTKFNENILTTDIFADYNVLTKEILCYIDSPKNLANRDKHKIGNENHPFSTMQR